MRERKKVFSRESERKREREETLMKVKANDGGAVFLLFPHGVRASKMRHMSINFCEQFSVFKKTHLCGLIANARTHTYSIMWCTSSKRNIRLLSVKEGDSYNQRSQNFQTSVDVLVLKAMGRPVLSKRKSPVPKRKTILRQVFKVIKDHLKTPSRPSIDNFIFSFFSQFCSLSSINENLRNRNPSVHQQNFLRVMFLKTILPLSILQDFCLAPPTNLDSVNYKCFCSPCSSERKFKHYNPQIIEQIRSHLGCDTFPSGFYESFDSFWGDNCPIKVYKATGELYKNQFPVMLFPCKLLPQNVKEKIVLNWPDHEIAEGIDRLFLCPDHFGPDPKVELPIAVRSDYIFSFSVEYILELLENGSVVFRHGVKGMKKLKYASHLIANTRYQPSFGDLKPVTEQTLQNIQRFLAMENPLQPSRDALDSMMEELSRTRSPSFSSYSNR